VRTAAVDPGPTVSGIVRFELPQRAKQRESMSAAQIERQARQLGECGARDMSMCVGDATPDPQAGSVRGRTWG